MTPIIVVIMNEDFKEGYMEAIKFIRFHKNFLSLTAINKQRLKSWEIAYSDLIDELLAHLKFNEDDTDNSSCKEL